MKKTMDIQTRNSEIVRKKNAGVSAKAIASEFGLSLSRIQQIVNRSRLEKEKEDRSTKLLGKIRLFDDIDKKWPTETLINDLQFPWKAKQCLTNQFCASKACEISLRDIMDYLVTDYEVMPNDLYAVCPAFQQKHVGSKTYSALVKYFSENDLGTVSGIEWKKRLKKLICFMKKRGGYFPKWLSQYEA